MLPTPLYGIVVAQELRVSSRSPFWQVKLKTCCGEIKCMMWDAPVDVIANKNYPHKGDFIKITSFKDQMADKGNIVINLPIDKILKEDYKTEYSEIIGSSGMAKPEEISEAMDVLFDENLFSNKMVGKFVLECFKQYEKSKIKSTPAATTNHHMYPGGLLIHTKEVLQTAKNICEVYEKKYPYINKDILFCSAILHDIGKIETYYINDQDLAELHYTEKSIGHLVIGMHSVMRVFEKLTAEEQEMLGGRRFIEEVAHCIGTHHGKPEYGSIQENQSIESFILSQADVLSAKFGMLDKTIRELPRDMMIKEGSYIKLHSDTSYFYSLGIENSRK